MSVWSKLGLADAASMVAMQNEILALRQENRELHEAQGRQSRQMFDNCIDSTQEAAVNIESKVSVIGEQLKSIQPALVSNLRVSQQEILSADKENRDLVMKQMSIISENQELFKEDLSSITASRERSLAQITDLLNEISAIQNKTNKNLQDQFSGLKDACHMISDGLVSLRETVQNKNGIEEKIVVQLDSWEIELHKILDKAQGVSEDIKCLEKYSESLWEAMKLVWINDLIDTTDKK